MGPYSCEAVLLALSDVYAQLRALDEAVKAAAASTSGMSWLPPDEFKRCA